MKIVEKLGLLLLSLQLITLTSLGTDRLELVGRILFPDQRVVSPRSRLANRVSASVSLEGTSFPYSSRVLAGPGGDFKFKDLVAGLYTLRITAPGRGSMSKTIHVTPSFAEHKNRVRMEIEFKASGSRETAFTVSASQLSIPSGAKKKLRRAEESLEKQDVPKARAHLSEALAEAPHFSAAWNRKGTIHFMSGEYADAKDCFEKALTHDSGAYAPLVNLGAALLVLGQTEAALEMNQEATVLQPDDPLAHSQLGRTYFNLGKFSEAAEHLREAKRLDPSHFSYPGLVLAEIFRLRDEKALLIKELEEFLSTHPDVEFRPGLLQALAAARADSEPQPVP